MTVGDRRSVVLIGMPASGKSTLGALLAKRLSLGFVDTDNVIQARERRTLQRIVDESGTSGLLAAEERALLGIQPIRDVVATGGSAVYSARAMEHLRSFGICVFLDVPLSELKFRLVNVCSRGIAMMPGQSLDDLFTERKGLYRRYADISLELSGAEPHRALEVLAGYLSHGLRSSDRASVQVAPSWLVAIRSRGCGYDESQASLVTPRDPL